MIARYNGKNTVLIVEIKYKSRRNIPWDKIEIDLKKYVGQKFHISETNEKVYVASDFPDEFCHSRDTVSLRGGYIKAKANAASVLEELIFNAVAKSEHPDYQKKHGVKAQFGWFWYKVYFGLPVCDRGGDIFKYDIYSSRMLVRRDISGRCCLYDFVNLKKEGEYLFVL